jgi:multicomponent Na+:H+ antiporter subunit D
MLFRQAREADHSSSGISEAPVSMLVPMYLLVIAGLYFGINGSQTLSIANDAALQLLGGF